MYIYIYIWEIPKNIGAPPILGNYHIGFRVCVRGYFDANHGESNGKQHGR